MQWRLRENYKILGYFDLLYLIYQFIRRIIMLKKTILLSLLMVGVGLIIISNNKVAMKSGGIIVTVGMLYGSFELLFRNSVELLSGSKITNKDLKKLPLEIQKKYRKATILVGILCLLGSILTMYAALYRL